MKKMQIKGSELKQIVQEELDNLMLDEGFADWAMAAGRKIGSAFSGTDKPDAPLAKPDEPTGKEPLDPTESPVQALGQTAIKQAAKDKKFYGAKPGAQKTHSAAMDTYHNAPDDRTRFDAVNTSRTARGKDPRQWGDTTAGKFQGRMGFDMGSKEHDAYTQDMIATTGGAFRDPDDPAPASDPNALAAANARLNAYRSGQGGYGAKSASTPAAHRVQESTQIKGSELKQVVKEELTNLIKEGPAVRAVRQAIGSDKDKRKADRIRDRYTQRTAGQPAVGLGGTPGDLEAATVAALASRASQGEGWHGEMIPEALKQIVQEELTKLIKEGGAMGHYIPNLITPAGDTPEDIAKQMLESGQVITDETATEAALNAGVLDDDLPDFVDAIIEILQDEDWESQVWKDASAQRGTQRPPHRPRMTNVEKAPESAAWKRRKAMHASEMTRLKGEK